MRVSRAVGPADPEFADFGLAPLSQGWVFQDFASDALVGFLGVRLADHKAQLQVTSTGTVDVSLAEAYARKHGFTDPAFRRPDARAPLLDRRVVRVIEYHAGLKAGVHRCFRNSWDVYVSALGSWPPDQKLFQEYIDSSVAGDLSDIETEHMGVGKRFYVAIDDEGRVLGHIAVHTTAGHVGTIFRMAVCQEAQRCGVAVSLLARAEEYACTRDCRVLALTTGAAMRQANEFYIAQGFACLERRSMGEYMANYFERPIAKTSRVRFGRNRVVRATDGTPVSVEGERWPSRVPKTLQHLHHNVPTNGFVARRVRKREQMALEHCYAVAWQTNMEISDAGMQLVMREYVRAALASDLSDPKRNYRKKGGEVFVAVSGDGRVYGCVAVTPEGELQRMAVHPAARGRGLARLLDQAVVAHCRKGGHKRVFLSTGSWMNDALRLYPALGYEHTGKFFFSFAPGFPPRHLCLHSFEKRIKKSQMK